MDRERAKIFVSIPHKAHRLLTMLMIAFFIFTIRIWYLAVVQHHETEKRTSRQRSKVVIEPAMRGTIRDRNNRVLAANSIEYRVGIMWAPIQDIPRRHRGRFLRKEYVQALSKLLARELKIDAKRIEENIYSYALFSRNSPLIVQKGLTEGQYYHLNFLARDWPGLVVERGVKRTYPNGRLGSHLLGYTAAISREEYDRTVAEIRSLKEYIQHVETGEVEEAEYYFDAKKRLLFLERKAYGLNDHVGKMGVEAAFERDLRGLYGVKKYVTNAYGEFIREAVGSKEPVSGKRIVLTLSAELQEWCERLLAENDEDRFDWHKKELSKERNPRVRGGAIIALDPRSGDILACASYPRFDPNDFGSGSEHIYRWIENERYIKDIWNLQQPVCIERVNGDEKIWLSWDHFIESILPGNSPLITFFRSKPTISKLLALQEKADTDQLCFDVRSRKALIDLSRLLVRKEEMTDEVQQLVGSLDIDQFRTLVTQKIALETSVEGLLREMFRHGPFEQWKRENKRAFLAAKRKEEAKAKIPARPFLYYLDREEKEQFLAWWTENKYTVLRRLLINQRELCPEWMREIHLLTNYDILQKVLQKTNDVEALLSSLKGYEQLDHPLLGKYSASVRGGVPKTGKGLIRSYLSLFSSPISSFCYTHPSPPGSTFKLIVAYAALKEQIRRFHRATADVMRMTDRYFLSHDRSFVGIDGVGRPIPRLYKGGRLPRSKNGNIGELDLVRAIGVSSNPYFSLLAGEYLETPDQLMDVARLFGYGQKTGLPIGGEVAGKLPDDLCSNRTGLYTTAIGQHTLLATPLQTAMAFSSLVNGGDLLAPRLVRMSVGPELIFGQKRKHFSYKDLMSHIGLHVPIWASNNGDVRRHRIEIPVKQVRKKIPLGKERDILVEGMRLSAQRPPSYRMRELYVHRPYLFSSHEKMRLSMFGKTSTAEVYERLGLGIGQPPFMYNHVSVASFFQNESQETDLAIVVFLRYGRLGRDASLLATSVADKWREIQKKEKTI